MLIKLQASFEDQSTSTLIALLRALLKASPPEAPIYRDLAHTPLDCILAELLFAARAEYMKRLAEKTVFEEGNALAVVSAYVDGMRQIVTELKSIGAIFQRKTNSGVPHFYTEEFESWFVQRETELL